MGKPGAREDVTQIGMGIHPEHAETLILVPFALRLQHRNTNGMIPAKDDWHIWQGCHFFTDKIKACTERSRSVPGLIVDRKVSKVCNAELAKPGAVLTEGSQMR